MTGSIPEVATGRCCDGRRLGRVEPPGWRLRVAEERDNRRASPGVPYCWGPASGGWVEPPVGGLSDWRRGKENCRSPPGVRTAGGLPLVGRVEPPAGGFDWRRGRDNRRASPGVPDCWGPASGGRVEPPAGGFDWRRGGITAWASPWCSLLLGPASGGRVEPPAGGFDWRRRRDSNPRNLSGFSGFQDRRLKPLGHPSAFSKCSEGVAQSGSAVEAAPPRKRRAVHGVAYCRGSSSGGRLKPLGHLLRVLQV